MKSLHPNQMADGRYRTRIFLGEIDGKKKYKSIYATSLKELKRKEAEFRKEIGDGLVPGTEKEKLSYWVKKSIELKDGQVTQSELSLFEFRVNYFVEELGDYKIKNIVKSDIQPIIDELYKCNPSTMKKSSKRTVERYLNCLSQVFENAIDDRYINYNPCSRVKVSNQAKVQERRSLTEEEIKAVITTEHRAKPFVYISLFTGLRRGELTALTWDDVDLKEKTITVNKSYDFKANEIKGPKSKAGYRTIPIPELLFDYISVMPHTSQYVCPSARGLRMTESAWKRLWESYMLALQKVIVDFEPFTFHCLRHTYATMLYESNCDVLTAKSNLGHSDIKVTLGIYTHLSETHKKNKITGLNEYISTFKNQEEKSG